MSLKIDDYLNAGSVLTTSAVQSTTASQTASRTDSRDFDSYIASAVDENAAIPSENYNDILKVRQSAKAESSGTSASSASSEGAVGGAASGGSGGGSDSEDETTTEIVRINGVTYLETTTTTDGVTTVTRTVISGNDNSDANAAATKTDSSTAKISE